MKQDSEKKFEADIESYLISAEGGWERANDSGYRNSTGMALDIGTLVKFVQTTQPKKWDRFLKQHAGDPVKNFYKAFETAVECDGMIHVLRHGFKDAGNAFRVCYFKPESSLNTDQTALYAQNICQCVRQWHYSEKNNNSVDMLLSVNGIPLAAIELKNQLTGQSVENGMRQWCYDRDAKEPAFRLDHRVLVFLVADLYNCRMTTALRGKDTEFLPFDQGTGGAGHDGGAGNPPAPENGDYVTAYLWRNVLQKDSFLDIMHRFISVQEEKHTVEVGGKKKSLTTKKIIFPRYHQLDVVRKLIAHVCEHDVGHNYLIQHSAGSGKSNSIAWMAYRLASLHRKDNTPVFSSVVVVTDRRVLDAQLQNTITGFEHVTGLVTAIDTTKTSKDLRDALNNGDRLIITTLQKFPVIFDQVNKDKGRNFAVIVDEAHSSQTGDAAAKLKIALGNTDEALKEYAEIEGKAEEEVLDNLDIIGKELLSQGKHDNLCFFAFTATPKAKTLEMFGERAGDGSFHPFHIYSMRQAVEEGFINDVLKYYTTYDHYYKILKDTPENPELPTSSTMSAIRRYEQLHPYNIERKSEIIVETYRDITSKAIGGRGKMMVVTASRLAAVRYFHAINEYIRNKNYQGIGVFVAFSGEISDPMTPGVSYSESGMNRDSSGQRVNENQTKAVFHREGNVLIVAEKYQTGFDEPLLHTMVVDKPLRDVKAVQTLSRLNRIYPGKVDTFVLDFVNSEEDIKKAFQPYYQETALDEEVNVNLIYTTQKKLAKFRVYNSGNIDAFIQVYADERSTENSRQARVSSVLKGVVDAYNTLEESDRYLFRRTLRSFVKYYEYIGQIIRMFDRDLHGEYLFCRYLGKLLPEEQVDLIDLGAMLQLEFYKLDRHAVTAIQLDKKQGVLEQNSPKPPDAVVKAPRDLLEEIIRKVNEQYGCSFSNDDRVQFEKIFEKLWRDKNVLKLALESEPKIFRDNQFPKYFDEKAREAYMENVEFFTALFQDKKKYDAMQQILADLILDNIHAKSADKSAPDTFSANDIRSYKPLVESYQPATAIPAEDTTPYKPNGNA